MPDIITEAEQKAITNFRGKVTKCPPRTFAIDAANPQTLRDQINNQWKHVRSRANSRRSEEGKERRERILSDAPRLTIAELARKEGVTRRTVSEILREAGVSAKPERQPVSIETLRELAATRTAKQIAEVTGLAVKTVHNRCAQAGIEYVRERG
ncbi:MAG: hypothetical protein ACQEUZ_06295 [Pseudomonadota bacterium]